MCNVSFVGDQYTQKWGLAGQSALSGGQGLSLPSTITREEFDRLKAEVLQMKTELLAAKAKDIAEGAPDCEMEEKIATIKAVAKLVGVSLESIFPVKITSK